MHILEISFDSNVMIFILVLTNLIVIAGWIFLNKAFERLRIKIEQKINVNDEGNRLKLQALERLTLYAERSGLSNLIGRIDSTGLNASDYYQILTHTLKTEYEYNLSQQVYVSQEVWHAITRLKDQNIYIINHITANLPPQATAVDLSKLILEYSMTPNAEMNSIVLDALQFEAKKILN